MHNQFVALLSQASYHQRVSAVVNALVAQKRGLGYILKTLLRAIQCFPNYTEKEHCNGEEKSWVSVLMETQGV